MSESKTTDRSRHYGLAIGDEVEERAFGSSLRGTVIGFSPTDNNLAYLRLKDGTEHGAVAEYCRRATVTEAEWWELRDVEFERVKMDWCQLDWCFSFACACREKATAITVGKTGVNYADE